MEGAYCFCELHRPIEGGTQVMISWIPQRIATVGNRVRLKDSETGQWTENWRVESVSEPRPAAQVEMYARNSHRAARNTNR